jgi:hypothetical protein
MLNYISSFSFLISTFLLSQIFACQNNQFVYRLESLNNAESLLCINQPNHKQIRGTVTILTFKVRPRPPQQDDSVDTTSIEVIDQAKYMKGVKPISLGKSFKVNEIFTYQGEKWKILHIGHHGVTVAKEEYCRYGFVYVKQLN